MMDEIMTDAEYHVALKEMYRLLNSFDGSNEAEIVDRLSELDDAIEKWEEEHYPM